MDEQRAEVVAGEPLLRAGAVAGPVVELVVVLDEMRTLKPLLLQTSLGRDGDARPSEGVPSHKEQMVATYLSSAEVVELTNLLKLIRELQASAQIGIPQPTEAISLLKQQAEKIINRLNE